MYTISISISINEYISYIYICIYTIRISVDISVGALKLLISRYVAGAPGSVPKLGVAAAIGQHLGAGCLQRQPGQLHHRWWGISGDLSGDPIFWCWKRPDLLGKPWENPWENIETYGTIWENYFFWRSMSQSKIGTDSRILDISRRWGMWTRWSLVVSLELRLLHLYHSLFSNVHFFWFLRNS